MKLRLHPVAMCATAWMILSSLSIRAQTPEIVIHTVSRPPESVLLSVRPSATNWVLLEASQDLAAWVPVANLLITNFSGPFVDYPPSNSPIRFYRVRLPGVSVDEAVRVWDARKPSHYQYRFQSFKLEHGGVFLAGTVTVSNEVKTVTNVTANGFSTADFDPDDFLTPEAVFVALADAEVHGARIAQVSYDPYWGLPATVMIMRSEAGYFVNYESTEFVDMTASGTANQTVQRTGASRSAQETNRTSSAAGSRR